MSGENYRSATKSHDPGWNDPPKLSYAPGMSPGQATTKLNLNKRVAFPVANSGSPKPHPAAVGNLPPPVGSASSLPQFVPPASVGSGPPSTAPPPVANPAGTAPPPLPVPMVMNQSAGSKQDATAAETFPEDSEMKDLVKESLRELLARTECGATKQAEIQKRLDVMQRSWNEGKLGEGLTKKLYRLVQALNETNVTEANAIHRAIIVDHGKDCVQWAPALRQLIQAIPRQEEEPPVGTEENSLSNGIMTPI